MASIDRTPPIISYKRTGRAEPVPEDTSPVWKTLLWYLLACIGMVVGLAIACIVLGTLIVLLFSSKLK